MAISTNTDIANYALNIINAGSIADIAGTDRVSALCTRYIDSAFDDTISEGKFTSCKARSDLIVSSLTPVPGYSYAYELPLRSPAPNGYVKALSLESTAPFEIEGGYLSTSDQAPRLLYLYRPQNFAKYGPFVLEAIAARLATFICLELTADTNKLAVADATSTTFMRKAKSHSLSEKNGERRQNSRWNDFNNDRAFNPNSQN